jgi:hypothetical protein
MARLKDVLSYHPIHFTTLFGIIIVREEHQLYGVIQLRIIL